MPGPDYTARSKDNRDTRYRAARGYHASRRQSSVLRPDLPGFVPPLDFAVCAYTSDLAVHACFRQGEVVPRLTRHPVSIMLLPIPRKTSGRIAPILDIRPSAPGSPSGFVRKSTAGVYIDEAAGFLMLRPGRWCNLASQVLPLQG